MISSSFPIPNEIPVVCGANAVSLSESNPAASGISTEKSSPSVIRNSFFIGCHLTVSYCISSNRTSKRIVTSLSFIGELYVKRKCFFFRIPCSDLTFSATCLKGNIIHNPYLCFLRNASLQSMAYADSGCDLCCYACCMPYDAQDKPEVLLEAAGQHWKAQWVYRRDLRRGKGCEGVLSREGEQQRSPCPQRRALSEFTPCKWQRNNHDAYACRAWKSSVSDSRCSRWRDGAFWIRYILNDNRYSHFLPGPYKAVLIIHNADSPADEQCCAWPCRCWTYIRPHGQ